MEILQTDYVSSQTDAGTYANKTIKASRITWVDHARGLAIILVVYRHVAVGLRRSGVEISNLMYNFQEVFYNFRMPVFFILSGVFVANSLHKRSVSSVLKDRASTLLYPYLLWGTGIVILEIVFSRFTNSKRDWSDLLNIIVQPRAIDHLWYLLALFNTTILFLILRRITIAWIHLLLAAILHTLTFTFLLQQNSFLSDPFYFYPYFLVGAYLSRVFLDQQRGDQLLKATHLIWLLPVFFAGQYFWFTHMQDAKSLFFIFFIINLLACYFVYIMAKGLAKSSMFDWLAYLGKSSLYIYILHVPIAAVIRILLLRTTLINEPWIILILCALGGLLTPIIMYNSLKKFGFARLFSLKHTNS